MGSKRSRKLLAIAAFAIVGAAGCVNGDATTGQAEDAMKNAGANDEQAKCIGNRLENLDKEQLNEVGSAQELSDLSGVTIPDSDQDLYEYLTQDVLPDCMGSDSPETTSPEGEEPSSTEETDGEGDGSGGE